jgi:hypothetical protein
MNTTTTRHSKSSWNRVLGASALVLLALVCVQGGRALQLSSRAAENLDTLPAAGRIIPASMDVVTQAGEYTAMTFNAGSDDVLAVLDGRGEQLFVYRVRNQREIEFISRDDLKNIFSTARRLGPGKP